MTAAERGIRTVAARIAATFPGVPIVAIANPHAGSAARRRALIRIVRSIANLAAPAELVAIDWSTDFARARAGVETALSRHGGDVVCISFGGDGTHNRIMSAFVGEDRLLFYRVPAGTGNDAVGSDLGALIDHGTVATPPRRLGAVEVTTRSRRFHAFNIASVGLDAYITATRDRLKSLLPYDTYRVAADIGVLWYERSVGLTDSALWLDGIAQPIGRRMLIAMGVDAPRTYGGNMPVLPGRENVCEIGPVTLAKRLRLKRLFLKGRHVAEPEVRMHRATTLTLHYDRDLPMQIDGEVVPLTAEQFPLRMRIVPGLARVIDPGR